MVAEISRIVNGDVLQCAERDSSGLFHCYPEGQTMKKYSMAFDNLEDAADYLVKNRRSRIRMEPGQALIVDNIFIDGKAREDL